MSDFFSKYSIDKKSIKSIEWKSQDSTKNSVLFYTLNDSQESKEVFLERVKDANFSYCIINKDISTEMRNIICVDPIEFQKLQKELCDYIYPLPIGFKSICLTGTNGKTTTVDLIRQLAIQANKSVLTIGTLGVWKNNKNVEDFGLTSPSFIDFRKYLNKYGKNIDILAVEVSSHALVQKRFFDFEFDFGAWTNISQDHLDYHKSMDEYFNAKKEIFKIVKGTVSVIENEDFLSKLNVSNLKKIRAKYYSNNSFLKIEYNQKNMTLAEDMLESCGLNLDKINMDQIVPPPGRFNIFDYKEGHVIIDFAHTPDALLNICKEIKKSFPKFKLVTVFGCGGDRDKTKRPLMGEVATENSDYTFITSDNPRFENPDNIINDIIEGLDKSKFDVEIDRKNAITKSMKDMDNKVILIAGKGHENYIDQNGIKTQYSDEEVVKEVISND